MECGWLVADRFAVFPNRVEHDSKHCNENDSAQNHHDVASASKIMLDLCTTPQCQKAIIFLLFEQPR
jgi:hypothetical protein